jgi:hypothetical protein
VDGFHRGAEATVAEQDFPLRTLPFLDIDDQHIDAIDGAIGDITRNIADFGRTRGAVRSVDHGIRNDLLAAEGTIEISPAGLEKRLTDDFGSAAADNLLGAAAEPFQITVIGELIDIVTIDISDQNRQGIGEPA